MEVIEDMVEAAAVAAIEAVVDTITAADTTITTGTEVTDTMAEVEAEDAAMVMRDNLTWKDILQHDLYQEAGVVVVMGAAVDMITEVVMATEMVVTKESCISQQHDHTLTSRVGGHRSYPPCPSLCGEFSRNFCVFSICLQFYVAFLNPF